MRLLCPRGLAIAFAGMAGMAGVRAGTPSADDAWPIGRPVPIAVEGGSARFVVPTSSDGSRTLIVVSTLAPSPGSYSIRIEAIPSDRAEPPVLEARGPDRAVEPPSRPAFVVPDPAPALPRPERTFFVQDRDGDPASPSNYGPVAGVLRAFGPRIQVYVDRQDVEAVDETTLADVVATFEGHVLPASRDLLGTASDVDGDGRFSVLVSAKLGRLASGRLSVDGFVRGADFEANLSPPLGNRCDMLYLNAALKSGPHLRTVLAHEYTHASVYCRKVLIDRGDDEEGWLDEALAHLMEDLHGFSRSNLDHRVAAFLAAPERYRLRVADYGAADLIRSHGHRGATYLFLKWCVERHGVGLIGTLANSRLRGVANLEAATGSRFADLFRDWSVLLSVDRMRGGAAGAESPGPRFARILPGGRPDRWLADGTTMHHAILEPSASGAAEVRIIAPPEAAIQVTAVRLPEDLPKLDLEVAMDVDAGGNASFVAQIRHRHGRPVRVVAMGWEASDPAKKPRELRGEALTTVLGARDRLSPGETIATRPVPLGKDREDTPTILHVVTIDEQGRGVTAWAEVSPKNLPLGGNSR